MKIEDEAPQAVKNAVENGAITIHQGYRLTKALQGQHGLTEKEQEQAAISAVEREIKEKQDNKLKKIDEKTRVAKLFSAAFEKAVQLEVNEQNIRTWIEQTGILVNQLDRTAKDAEKISRSFATIANVIKNRIKPEYRRFQNERETRKEALDPRSGEDGNASVAQKEIPDISRENA